MKARTLIAKPLMILATVLVIGAIVNAGHATRERSPVATGSLIATDAVTTAEQERIRSLVASVQQCELARQCTGAAMAQRLTLASKRVDSWPRQPRFVSVRRGLQRWLVADARVRTIVEAIDADQRRTIAESSLLAQAARERLDAEINVANTRHAAGLDDDRSRETLVHTARAAQQRLIRTND